MKYENKHDLVLLFIIGICTISISYLRSKYFMNIAGIVSFFTNLPVRRGGAFGRPGSSGEVAGPRRRATLLRSKIAPARANFENG
jgi:hypothetical protein